MHADVLSAALSGKAESEMLGAGLTDLDKEVAALESKKLALETEHQAIQTKLATTKTKHLEIVCNQLINLLLDLLIDCTITGTTSGTAYTTSDNDQNRNASPT